MSPGSPGPAPAQVPGQPPEALRVALTPLLRRIGAELVPADGTGADDVPVPWEGSVSWAVRLGLVSGDGPSLALSWLITAVESELGAPLAALDRAGKQRAVRMLEERGAFTVRRSAETIADALGVTRFTVYNYLNRERPAPG